ncbi:hypothetical protein Ancab_019625 [Ancistrocladus abbreviatus]
MERVEENKRSSAERIAEGMEGRRREGTRRKGGGKEGEWVVLVLAVAPGRERNGGERDGGTRKGWLRVDFDFFKL